MRRTWRASKGLLRGEEEGKGEAAGGAAAAAAAAGAAAVAAALAAGGGGWAATWEGEEQEMSNLQESTALIPDVRSSIFHSH